MDKASIARDVKGTHRLTLLLGLPVFERPRPQRHCLHLTKRLSWAQVSDLFGDPRVWGTFRKHCCKSKEQRKICIHFSFLFLPKIFLRNKKQHFSLPDPAILFSPQLASPQILLPGSWAHGKCSWDICTVLWRYTHWLGASKSWNSRKYNSISMAPCPALLDLPRRAN